MAQLPVSNFLTARLLEYDPNYELRSGTGFESLFFKPMQFIVQPMRDEAASVFTSQSLLRILLTDSPDDYNENDVDDIVGNVYVLRRQGNNSSGVARAYYNSPVTREYPTNSAVFTGSNGLTYSNPSPFVIDQAQMELQLEQGMYYMDIPIQSDTTGLNTELAIGEIVSLANDTEVAYVTNLSPVSGGLDREKNTALIDRAQQSIGVRDLVTGKGFKAILFENFLNNLLEAQPVGFGDSEMMRDIVFNTHIGGRVDGWVKTSSITIGSKDFVGVLTDTTRQTFASKNITLSGIGFQSVGNTNIDRSNNKIPTVKEIKPAYAAQFISTVNMSTPVNLSVNQHVKIGIDGVEKTIRVAGAVPGATTRNEILNLINSAFGYNIAFISGNFIKIRSITQGLNSSVVITNPDYGNSAIMLVFGLSTITAPHTFVGDGPVTFVEGTHYEINDGEGNIRRIIGPVILGTQTTGQTTADSSTFVDITPNIFLNVIARDVVTISGVDYRVLSKTDNNTLVLDKKLTVTGSAIYTITRTGIKNNELVYAEYYYNPLSIDIGKMVALDSYKRARGVRTGRELFTITDVAVLRINSIEEIDPLTLEPTGYVLDGTAGFGQGGYGKKAYGIGSGSEWRLVVNEPTARFSVFDDSYIVLNSGFEGLSFKVNYDYVPEIEDYHNFVRSADQRVLDGDILMKHFIPAYVSGEIRYSVAASNTTAPTNDAIKASLATFINTLPAGVDLQFSDILQFVLKTIDPYTRYDSYVEPFVLSATIHNTDGTTVKISGTSKLTVPNYTPIFTTKPLSARTTHWIADAIALTRF